MTQLTDLLKAVQDQNLPKGKLEEYYSAFLSLFSQIELELADLEKAEALYIDSSEEKTDAARVRKWRATESGQRLIELKRKSKVVDKQLSSVRHRIYAQY